jgi:hypothetical protein
MVSDVFISHAHEDHGFARRLVCILKRRGGGVAVSDAEFAPGQDFAQHLAKALDGSDAIVLLLSPAALSSSYVMSEVGAALASKKPVIPVVPPNRRLPRDVSVPFEQADVLRAGKLSDAEIASSLIDSLRRATAEPVAG